MRKYCLRLAALTLLALLFGNAALADLPIVHKLSAEWKAPYETVTAVEESPFAQDEALLCIDILGIRQGDCIIVRCGGKTMLIDGGEKIRYQMFKRYLEDHGIEGFDAFFLSHHHDDHIELQTLAVKRGIPVGVLYAPYDSTEQAAYWREYKAVLKEKNVPIEVVKDQDEIDFGGATIRVYRNPTPNLSTNDGSAAVMITFGEAKFFSGADMTGTTQHWLYDHYADELDCDVLKCFHHGNNATLSELLDAFSPSLCVITNQKTYTAQNDSQLDRRDIPRYYINQTIHLETDGKMWYVWPEKMR